MTRTRLIVLALILSALAAAQSSSLVGSSLVVRVSPEAYLSPASLRLSFPVISPGESVLSQPVTITAWVRALPNQTIQVRAQAVSLTGPTGAVSAGSLRFSGALVSATGGATVSRCTSNSFSGGLLQPLIEGWNQSGIATCSVSFALDTDPAWPAGSYTAQADLKLTVQ